jgi:preprotein translocase subunit Sec61beta
MRAAFVAMIGFFGLRADPTSAVLGLIAVAVLTIAIMVFAPTA